MKIFTFFTTLFFCQTIYAVDYWDWWHAESKHVSACRSYEKNAIFFKSALLNLGNAERSQTNAEIIENLAVSKPVCLIESVSYIELSICKSFYIAFIENPIFIQKELVHTRFHDYKALCISANKAAHGSS